MSPPAAAGRGLGRVSVIAGAAAVLVVACGGWWATTRSPEVAFLPAGGGARWIVFPRAARIGIRPAVELESRFRGSLTLAREPESATLRYRAFRECEISINGAPVRLPESGNWKRFASVDVAAVLRGGENEILVRVRNDRGPPALWLELASPGGRLATDDTWSASLAGSVWRPAQPARAGYDPARIDPDVSRARPVLALRARWRTLATFALVAGMVVLGVGAIARRAGGKIGDPRRAEEVLLRGGLMLAVASWVLIFVNNAPSLSAADGFDAEGHLAYVQYILDHGRLPAAEEGWSMFQPPLYYLVSAATLKLAGLSTVDPAAGTALRMLGLLLGVAQLLLLYGCLARIFPDRPAARAVGGVVGVFLPLQLYTFQYVGNDGLAAVLSTAVVYLALKLLAGGRSGIGPWGALGLLMGAAVLSKLTAMIVVVVVIVAVAASRFRERAPAVRRATGPAVMAATALAVGGWHYARMAWRYGSPVAGNWDPAVHPPWWQDPGVLTGSFYPGFRRALSLPLLSAYNGFADGIYTTLWGDGLIGGRGEIALGPPWNLELMAAGYVVALVPTVLALVGAATLAFRLFRRPDATGFVLVGVGAMTLLALAAWPLENPIYSVVKASFGLPAMVSLCAFAGAGFDLLGGRRVLLRWLLGIAVGTWALSSAATFWVPRDDARAAGRLGWILARSESTRGEANAHLRAALAGDPHEPFALLGRARISEAEGRDDEAIADLRAVASWHGEFARARLELARLLTARGRYEEALEELHAVLETRPDDAQAHSAMGEILAAVGRRTMAIEQLREALRIVPDSEVVHRMLGALLVDTGREREGRLHLDEAERLRRVIEPGGA